MGILEIAKQRRAILEHRIPETAPFFREIMVPHLDASPPFLPIRAFRLFALDENQSRGAVFLSSGSTQENRARHGFSPHGLECYAHHAHKGFQEFLSRHNFAADTPMLSLVPPSDTWPQSSLAAMIEMFSERSNTVIYCPPENGEEKIFEILCSLGESDAILFGTSFHHVWMAEFARRQEREARFSGRRLMVIDTGGTKGRTEIFTRTEVAQMIAATYGNPAHLVLTSEYGMCELASQAWSCHVPHDGTFCCNGTLTPLALCPRTWRVLPHGETGFLAFLDENNFESFPCVVTEDLGATLDLRTFQLQGRAPDATLKGCSLNVRDNFFTVADRASSSPRSPTHEAARPFSIPSAFDGGLPERMAARLSPSCWSPPLLQELLSSLQGWEFAPAAMPVPRHQGEILEIVSSANIPITWLYPAAVARLLGYSEVRVMLPSLRGDDPLSSEVIAQSRALAEALQEELAPMHLHVLSRGIPGSTSSPCHRLLIFGSDVTCATLRASNQHRCSTILSFGEVWNSTAVSDESAEELASQVTAWRGRGCLTPLILFLSAEDATPSFLHEHMKAIAAAVEKRMERWMGEAGEIYRFAHRHDIWELESRLAHLPGRGKVLVSPHSALVDLVSIPPDQLHQANLPWKSAGTGLVFVLGGRDRYPWMEWLDAYPVRPGILDPHQGKSWAQWLDEEHQAFVRS